YRYRVGATDGATTSYSAVVPATTLAAPPAPAGLVATVVSSSRINLAWTDNAAYEQGFKLERSPDGVTFTQIAQLGANVTSYANTSPAADTTSRYRTRASAGPNNSASSNTVAPATLPPPPAPSGLGAVAVSPSRIDLAWTDNSTYETGFRVERSTDGVTFTQMALVAANATTASSTSLIAGTTYSY